MYIRFLANNESRDIECMVKISISRASVFSLLSRKTKE